MVANVISELGYKSISRLKIFPKTGAEPLQAIISNVTIYYSSALQELIIINYPSDLLMEWLNQFNY